MARARLSRGRANGRRRAQGFKTVEAAVATLPVELQRVALKDEMRSAIEVGDFDGASTDLNDFQTIGVPRDMEPAIAVLMGRLAEGMGRTEDALVGLSDGGGFLGPSGRGARPAARNACCAIRSAISSATTSSRSLNR